MRHTFLIYFSSKPNKLREKWTKFSFYTTLYKLRFLYIFILLFPCSRIEVFPNDNYKNISFENILESIDLSHSSSGNITVSLEKIKEKRKKLEVELIESPFHSSLFNLIGIEAKKEKVNSQNQFIPTLVPSLPFTGLLNGFLHPVALFPKTGDAKSFNFTTTYLKSQKQQKDGEHYHNQFEFTYPLQKDFLFNFQTGFSSHSGDQPWLPKQKKFKHGLNDTILGFNYQFRPFALPKSQQILGGIDIKIPTGSEASGFSSGHLDASFKIAYAYSYHLTCSTIQVGHQQLGKHNTFPNGNINSTNHILATTQWRLKENYTLHTSYTWMESPFSRPSTYNSTFTRFQMGCTSTQFGKTVSFTAGKSWGGLSETFVLNLKLSWSH